MVMSGTLIGAFSLAFLTRRWQRANAEAPLLALLPGLGDAARVRRALLLAGLGLPLSMHAAVALMFMVFWQQYGQEFGFVLLAQCGSAALTTAMLLNLFGGKFFPIWGSALLFSLCQVLTILSWTLPQMAAGSHPVEGSGELLPPLVLAWLLLGLAMVWLGHRGWVGLVQKPHPFLPS